MSACLCPWSCPLTKPDTKALDCVLLSSFSKIGLLCIKSEDVLDQRVLLFGCPVVILVIKRKIKFLAEYVTSRGPNSVRTACSSFHYCLFCFYIFLFLAFYCEWSSVCKSPFFVLDIFLTTKFRGPSQQQQHFWYYKGYSLKVKTVRWCTSVLSYKAPVWWTDGWAE